MYFWCLLASWRIDGYQPQCGQSRHQLLRLCRCYAQLVHQSLSRTVFPDHSKRHGRLQTDLTGGLQHERGR